MGASNVEPRSEGLGRVFSGANLSDAATHIIGKKMPSNLAAPGKFRSGGARRDLLLPGPSDASAGLDAASFLAHHFEADTNPAEIALDPCADGFLAAHDAT